MGKTALEALEMMKEDEAIVERDEIMIEGTEKATVGKAVEEDGGEDTKTQEETVAEVEEVDIKTTEGIDTKEKREMAIETIEEISPQAKEDLATTMKMPEPKIIIGRWMDGEVTRKKTTRNPLRSMDS